MACWPMMTRPGCSASAIALRIFATASGSTGPSALTRMARAAPLGNAGRLVFERLDRTVGLYQDAAVGAHGKRGANGFGGLLRTDRDGDNLGGLAGLLDAER